jgi:hypothetical protein
MTKKTQLKIKLKIKWILISGTTNELFNFMMLYCLMYSHVVKTILNQIGIKETK